MMPRQHPTPDRRRLAAALKQLREDTGLSAERFGEPHNWSQGKVSKIENGRTVPSAADAETWARSAGHPEMAAELGELAESVGIQSRGYAGRSGPTLAARAERVGVLEAQSTVVRQFQPAAVPGLLQTADYARRVLSMLGRDPEEIPPAVNARMQRQDALYQPGRRFEFLLTEGALRWRPVSPEAMAGQYDRLLRVAEADAVELRVLSFAMQAPIFYDNPFIIYEVPDDPVVLAEATPASAWYEQEDKVETCRAAFAQGWAAALSGSDALGVIQAVARELAAG